jgi:hypothetical protein
VKKAEREEVLTKKFADDLEDPKSGLMDALMAKVDEGARARIAELEAEDRARRMKRFGLAAAGVLVVALGIWYFALRDTRTSCEKLVGPIGELSKLTGVELSMNSGHETKYSCYQYVDRKGRAGGFVVNIDTGNGTIASESRELASRKFTEKKTLQTPLGEAVMFVAGDTTPVSQDALQADIMSRVGKSADPTGDALNALPPSQHVVLMEKNRTLIRLSMDREVFTVDKAIEYANAVAKRAK